MSADQSPPPSAALPRVEAAATEVFVIADRLDEDGPLSYHEREGCYNAADAVPWPVAIDAGARPCGRCCESFEVVSVDER